MWGGRGTAGPRPVLLCCYRFDETGCPARPFSACPSIAGPSRTSSTHRPGVLADRPRDGLVLPVRRTAVTIRRRAASKRASSIDVRRGPRGYASPRLHRSTTARRRRGTWIRRPPHRRDGEQCTSGSSYGGKIGSRICEAVGKAGECFLNPTIDPRKGSTASRLLPTGGEGKGQARRSS